MIREWCSIASQIPVGPTCFSRDIVDPHQGLHRMLAGASMAINKLGTAIKVYRLDNHHGVPLPI
jgi:hypothetical protein